MAGHKKELHWHHIRKTIDLGRHTRLPTVVKGARSGIPKTISGGLEIDGGESRRTRLSFPIQPPLLRKPHLHVWCINLCCSRITRPLFNQRIHNCDCLNCWAVFCFCSGGPWSRFRCRHLDIIHLLLRFPNNNRVGIRYCRLFATSCLGSIFNGQLTKVGVGYRERILLVNKTSDPCKFDGCQLEKRE